MCIRDRYLANPFLLSASISFLLGIFIEILQPILTEYREGSFFDAIFNLLGIISTLFLVTFKKIFFGTRN